MVENLIQSKYGPIEESVKAQLTEIIHRCQEDVFQSFRMFQLGPSNNQNELEGMTTSGENSLLCQQGQDLEPIFAPPPPISDDLTLPTIQDVEMSRSQWAGIEAVNSSDSAYSSLELFKHSEEEFLNFNWLEAGPNFPQTNEHAREGANETAPESHTFRRPPAPN